MLKAIRSITQGFLAVSLLVTAQTLSAQGEVPLHVKPDIDSPVHAHVPLSLIDRYNPQPILTEGFVGQGWETVLYRGNYIGYVRNNTLAGDYVRPGTQVYAQPNGQSPVVQTLETSRQAYLRGRANNEWSQVVFNGVLPLYFMRSNAEPLPASNRDTQPDAYISRTHVGKFERVSSVTRMLGGNYDYQLSDSQGKVIAYVDIKNALFVGPIEDYWNKNVTIEGTSRDRPGSVPLVIEARFLGLR